MDFSVLLRFGSFQVPDSTDFGDHVRELVASGDIPEARVDVAAGRVLQLKKDLGLLADPFLIDSVQNSIGVSYALQEPIASWTVCHCGQSCRPWILPFPAD